MSEHLSPQEISLVVAEIFKGRIYEAIGDDWLISKSAVCKIARKNGHVRGRGFHPKPFLTKTEAAIAWLFARRQIVSRSSLSSIGVHGRVQGVMIVNLRKKLNNHSIEIKNKWGEGWYLDKGARVKLSQLLATTLQPVRAA